MKVLAGEQVLICLHGEDVFELATVLAADEDTATLAINREACLYIVGSQVSVSHRMGEWRARAIVASVEPTSAFAILHLDRLSADGKTSRARRHEFALNVAADYRSDTDNVKRTIGHTSNLSTTGVRVRLRTALKIGTAARLVIRVGTEGSIEVLARVVRIIPGSESSGGGYDVAFQFERVLTGYEYLCQVAPEGSTLPCAVAAEDEDDWFSTPDAV
jgi:hypothetical protein